MSALVGNSDNGFGSGPLWRSGQKTNETGETRGKQRIAPASSTSQIALMAGTLHSERNSYLRTVQPLPLEAEARDLQYSVLHPL